MKHTCNLILIILALVFIFSCTNETETLVTENVADYKPMQVGKYIIYRLDSTVFTQSGSKIETHKYQVKHTVKSETTDNLGRKTYIIERTINNENANSPWIGNGNYLVTPSANHIEVIENNLRVVPLQMPMKVGFKWKGNQYLALAPFQSLYEMNAGLDMNTWEFSYTNKGNEVYAGQTYPDAFTIIQNENVQNIPPSSSNSFGVKEVSIEKYSKNIGLVYKEFHLYEYQPPHADNPSGAYMGFGITMWMISHN